jgi:hypothetical protein
LGTTGNRKATHTGLYLHFELNYPACAKRGMVHSSVYKANMICQSKEKNNAEIGKLRKGLLSDVYPFCFVDFVVHKKSRNRNLERRSDVYVAENPNTNLIEMYHNI